MKIQLCAIKPFFVSLCAMLLISCGGGGGGSAPSGGSSAPGGSSTSFSLSTNTIDFNAVTPSSSVSTVQVTGTVSGQLSGTLYILVTVSGQGVSSLSSVTINQAAQSGTFTVYPESAATLGEGSYSGSISITACLNDPTCKTGQLTGSPQVIKVNYTVGPPSTADVVMPGTVASGNSGNVIIRGKGFQNNGAVNQVSFGANPAASFTVISDTEIHASYPALTAGSYSINLSNSSGSVPSTVKLAVVDSHSFTDTTLSYPVTPQQTLGIVYDAKQQALFVAASYFDGTYYSSASRAGNQILRYQFSNGSFVSLSTKTIPLLQDITLSPDSDTLLAVTDTQVIELNPADLSILKTTTRTGSFISSQYMKNIVMMNDGNALITTGYVGSGSTPVLQYSLKSQTINTIDSSLTYNGTATTSRDGARAVIIEGSLSPPQPIQTYNASSGLLKDEASTFNQVQCINSGMGSCLEPAVNGDGTNTALIGSALDVVLYDQNFGLLGFMTGSYGAAIFSKDKKTLYAYGSDSKIHTFDLTQTPVAGEYAETGTGTSLAGNPGPIYNFAAEKDVIRMTSTPDGKTLFIAGKNLIAIQTVP